MIRERDKAVALALVRRQEFQERTRVGSELPNGVTILAHSTMKMVGEEAYEGIVLAFQPEAVQQFVTWRHVIGVQHLSDGCWGPTAYTYSGDYYSSIQNAAKGYASRCRAYGV